MNWELIPLFFSSLSAIDSAVLIVNVLLIIFAQPLLSRFSSGTLPQKAMTLRIILLRGLNIIILIVYGYMYFYQPSGGTGGGIVLLSILAILYLTYFSNYLVQYYIFKLYGKERQIGDKVIYIETYKTRLFSILSIIVLTVISLISIIHQLGFDSLLEAGGVLGVMGVMLGLTQASWAPDIVSGLIILNSAMFEEGDIVEIKGDILGRVYKTRFFHTEILNIANNHRIMIRNAQLRDQTIHNLSKFASVKGLRECLTFKIGYDTPAKQIKEMFSEAFDIAVTQKIPLENQRPLAVKVLEVGDHAITWGALYYVKNVDKILNIRRDFKEIILQTSKEKGISLATPITHVQIQH